MNLLVYDIYIKNRDKDIRTGKRLQMKHIVIDLEMNTVSKKSEVRRLCNRETIEIGAVMLDEDLNEISAFRTYVKPEYTDRISGKISALTGITYEMVQNAPTFSEALRMFTNWCLGTGEEVTIYAWSKSDFTQVKKEMMVKEYEISGSEETIFNNPWSDFQEEFDSHLGFQKQVSLKMALDMAGVDFSGREHDALDDARNTAELLHIFREKTLFDLTLRKIKEAMEPTNINTTLGSMIDFSMFECA